jgi:hypothetical protein
LLLLGAIAVTGSCGVVLLVIGLRRAAALLDEWRERRKQRAERIAVLRERERARKEEQERQEQLRQAEERRIREEDARREAERIAREALEWRRLESVRQSLANICDAVYDAASLSSAIEHCRVSGSLALQRLLGHVQTGRITADEFMGRVEAWPASRRRFLELVERLERLKELAPRYSDPEWLRQHGRAYVLDHLAKAGQAYADVEAFHTNEPDVAECLWLDRRDLYEILFWGLPCIEEASRLDVIRRQPKPAVRQTPTTDEVRQRIVNRIRTEIEDFRAVEETLSELGLPEEQREKYVNRLRTEKREREEERRNGSVRGSEEL